MAQVVAQFFNGYFRLTQEVQLFEEFVGVFWCNANWYVRLVNWSRQVLRPIACKLLQDIIFSDF